MLRRKRLLVSIRDHLSIRRELVMGIRSYFRMNLGWEIIGGKLAALDPDDPESSSYDGAIAYLGTREDVEKARRFPFTVVNVCSSLIDGGVPQVIPDNYAIGRAAAEFLYLKGFRRFIVAGENSGDKLSRLSLERYRGFADWLSAQESKTTPKVYNYWSMKEPVPESLPCAIFAINDTIAYAYAKQLLLEGVRIPDDVVILGTDNDSVVCETCPVSLSSIDINAQRVGYLAAEVVYSLINGSGSSDFPLLVAPAKVVERSSTDRFAAEDSNVALARRLIATQALNCSFQIEDIVAVLQVSRRTLERKFKSEMGYTLHHEIKQVRVEHAKELLESSNLSVEKISQQCGMLDSRRFSDLFKAITGSTPSGYRQAVGK